MLDVPAPHQECCCALTSLLGYQVNKEPYSGGWLIKVKLSDKGELENLMDASKYEDHCAKEEH